MSDQRFTFFACGILAFFLATCTTAPPTTPPQGVGRSTPPEVGASARPSPPSLKPDLSALMGVTMPKRSPFPRDLFLCPRMKISNAPRSQQDRRIANYQSLIDVEGIKLALAPVEAGCFSSGFGPRNGRMHKGIDLYHAEPVKIYAAASGIIREKTYHKGYGNMLVIEHGETLFARYAHLERFAPNTDLGQLVNDGQTIGYMGKTSDYRIARHLHYEVLKGHYDPTIGAFGLTPVDIYSKLP